MSEITSLLEKCNAGEVGAQDRLYTLLYSDLKRLARSHLLKSGALTLDPSAIVHDAWLRCGVPSVNNRNEFFSYASAVIRNLIVDHVRERAAQKRGGDLTPVTLSTTLGESLPAQPDVVAVDDALKALKHIDARCHSVVEMRYFGGMTLDEIADVMDLSVQTIKRDWQRARAFLFDYLRS